MTRIFDYNVKGVPMKKNFVATMLVFVALTVVAGCKTKPVEEAPAPAPQTTTDTSGVDTSGAATEDAAGPSGELLSKRVVYFDLDRADIRADSQAVITAHARYLAGASSQKVRLEGHADERGSREYNIGLGERRAQAVRRALLLLGVAESQLATVSYGEERPAAAGSDEQAYSLNRRVEIVYVK
jgi:peptidoglycan-associated lipoprotein